MRRKLRNDTIEILRSPQGRIFLLGVSTVVVFIVWMGLGCILAPEVYRRLFYLAGMRLVIGRPGGVYFGYVLELGHVEVLVINLFVDVVAVFLLYPLFFWSWQKVLEVRSLKNFIQRVLTAAAKHQDVIQRYGASGLFLFVLFPLWGTGPVVGCAVGILMNLKPWVNMSIVLSATAAAIMLWALLLMKFHSLALTYNAYAPWIVIAVLCVIGFGRYLRHWGKKRP